jgi:hypothetical protein
MKGILITIVVVAVVLLVGFAVALLANNVTPY